VKDEIKLHPRVIDLTGRRFGRLTVKEYVGVAPGGGALWRCLCDCGGETKVRSQKLRDGTVVSDGCYRADPAVRREARLKTDEDVRRESARRAGEASAVVRWGAKKKKRKAK
jgi:hypothetical protein